MTADVPTLLLMTILSSGVMAGALLLLGWRSREDGLQFWAGALLLAAAGYGLFLLRGQIPDALSVVLGNVLVSASFSILLAAVRCFHAQPLRWWALLAPAALMAPLMVWGGDNLPLRIALSGTVMLGQVLWLLWTLQVYRSECRGRGVQLLMAGMVLEAGVLWCAVRQRRGWCRRGTISCRAMPFRPTPS